jgi:hypothetical protein
VENLQVQLIWPPVLVRRGPNRRVSVRSPQYWALAFSRHISFSRLLDFSIKFDTSGRKSG